MPAMTAVQRLHGWQTHRHRRQASSHICFVVPPSLPPHRPPHCGSGLARDDGGPGTARLANTPPSQASQLPHLFCGASKPPASPPPHCGSGLARDGGGPGTARLANTPPSQASSHICFVVPPSLPPHRPPHCGSGLARDGGGPGTARLADTPPSQASQLPHLFCGASKPPASPPPPLWERACPRWRRSRHCTAGRHTAIAGKPAPTFVLWCPQVCCLAEMPRGGLYLVIFGDFSWQLPGSCPGAWLHTSPHRRGRRGCPGLHLRR